MFSDIAVTGVGCLTSTGADVESTWQALGRGQQGIAPIAQWDVDGWPFQLAGEIKDYQPKKLLPERKLLKFISRQDVLGINAVTQAVADSGVIPYRDQCPNPEEFNYRTGVFVGSPGNKFEQQEDFMPLMSRAGDDMQEFAAHLFETVHPMWLLRTLPNNVLAYAGIQHGFKGFNHNITNHVVGGSQAMIEAAYAIMQGKIDRALVVSYDHGVEPQAVTHFGAVGLLSDSDLKPFDREHNGTIIAEGAGAIMLEAKDLALARGAKIYGELLGGCTTTDAMGVLGMDSEAMGLTQCLSQLLERTGLKRDDIGMVTAHGNGVVKSDRTEALALQSIFTDHPVPVTSFKWSLGHTLCGAGVIETILTLLSLKNRSIPGIANLNNVDPACGSLNISCDLQEPVSDYAVQITRAFSGLNTCLMLKGPN